MQDSRAGVRPNRMLASHPRQRLHPQQHTQGPTQNRKAYTHQAVRPTRPAQTCLSEHWSHAAMWAAMVPIARKARKLPALCTALGKAVLPPKGRTAELRHISPQGPALPPLPHCHPPWVLFGGWLTFMPATSMRVRTWNWAPTWRTRGTQYSSMLLNWGDTGGMDSSSGSLR